MSQKIIRLDQRGITQMRALNALFARAFDGDSNYTAAPPDDRYLADILARDDVVAVVAMEERMVIGGAVAYILPKLEQARTEIYIYDIAVAEEARRQGIATALIKKVRAIGATAGASAVFVQADYEDRPAVALYTKLGSREDVLHFDIDLDS